jgi:hypothetical protein
MPHFPPLRNLAHRILTNPIWFKVACALIYIGFWNTSVRPQSLSYDADKIAALSYCHGVIQKQNTAEKQILDKALQEEFLSQKIAKENRLFGYLYPKIFLSLEMTELITHNHELGQNEFTMCYNYSQRWCIPYLMDLGQFRECRDKFDVCVRTEKCAAIDVPPF